LNQHTNIYLINTYLNLKIKLNKYTDTSTFYNKYNIDNVERNKYFKNKKVMKLSFITNKKGIPLNIDLFKGNLNDMNIFNKQLDNLKIGLIDKKSTIFMADSGYDSIKLRSKLNNIFYKSIIPFNKRNTKDKNKIKTLTNEEKKLYKSRITIENTFLLLKKYRIFEIVYEKNF